MRKNELHICQSNSGGVVVCPIVSFLGVVVLCPLQMNGKTIINMNDIDWFIGDYHFLSNFHPSPFELNGTHYPTVEHAYQAAKSISPYQRDYILAAKSPGEAKKRGRKIACTEDWEGIKYGRMYKYVFAKFFQNPSLRQELLATYPAELIEGNSWGDTYWGVCNGEGENKLGQILMYVRIDLR